MGHSSIKEPQTSGDHEVMMSAGLINIPDNVAAHGISQYEDKYHDDLWWALRYARNVLQTRQRFLDALAYNDWTVISRVYQGKYPTLSSFIRSVQNLRKRVELEKEQFFIDTVVTRKMWNLYDRALANGEMVMISGITGRSKSETAKQWATANNHGRALYFECPPSGGYRGFIRELSKPMGIGKKKSTRDIEEAVTNAVGPRNIIIADEIYRVIPKGSARSIKELEYLRWLHDQRGCAIAVLPTRWAAQEMQAGMLQSYMEQFLGRITGGHLAVPDNPFPREIRQIVSAYNSRPSKKLIDLAVQIGSGFGKLRTLFSALKEAEKLCRARKQKMNETHLDAAFRYKNAATQFTEEETE